MKLPGNISFQLNTKPEKLIAAASLSAAIAILTTKSGKGRGEKRRRKGPNIFARAAKSYKLIDRILSLTLAKDVEFNEKKLLNSQEFKTKLRDLAIEDAVPFDPTEESHD